jgi:hypothetical protein
MMHKDRTSSFEYRSKPYFKEKISVMVELSSVEMSRILPPYMPLKAQADIRA